MDNLPKIRPIKADNSLHFGVFLTCPNGTEEQVYFTKKLDKAQLWIHSDEGKKVIKQFNAITGNGNSK